MERAEEKAKAKQTSNSRCQREGEREREREGERDEERKREREGETRERGTYKGSDISLTDLIQPDIIDNPTGAPCGYPAKRESERFSVLNLIQTWSPLDLMVEPQARRLKFEPLSPGSTEIKVTGDGVAALYS